MSVEIDKKQKKKKKRKASEYSNVVTAKFSFKGSGGASSDVKKK